MAGTPHFCGDGTIDALTEQWLKANGLDEYDRLLMRPNGERRPASEFKVEVIEALREEYQIVCAFEDRLDVADALRTSGTPVYLFGAGVPVEFLPSGCPRRRLRCS